MDDRDPAVQYEGSWTDEHYPNDANHTPNYAYNGTEMGSSDTSATCTYTFTGTGINLVSARYAGLGYLSVSIDGGEEEIVRLNGNIGHAKKRVVYSINGLENKEHTIVVKPYSGEIRIDGFGVMPKEKVDQSAQLIIDQQYYYPNLNWGSYQGIPAQIQLGTTGSATIRLTNQDNKIEKKNAAEYIDTTNIINVPDFMFAGISLNLSGIVLPENATNQSISFSIKDAGDTGAVLKGTRLTATDPGVVIITAKAQNMENVFEKDFAILVRADAAIGGEIELGETTESETAGSEKYLNDGIIGGSYWTDFSMDHYYDK